jgi:protein-S-isoprenylcysteine O-methyltransferase Ste14
MGARLVVCVFVVLAGATATKAVAVIGDTVLHDPSLRGGLVAGFWVLKCAVVGAFAYFVAVRPPASRPARAPVAFIACGVALGAAVLLSPPTHAVPTPLLVAGEALAAVGVVWLLASVLALGRCFGILPEARGLVTRGPYRIVRHPVYLGEIGICAGLVIGAPTAWNLTCGALLLGAQLVRMRLEERALEHEFPAYAAYAAATPRLLPAFRRGAVTVPALEPATSQEA